MGYSVGSSGVTWLWDVWNVVVFFSLNTFLLTIYPLLSVVVLRVVGGVGGVV